jgi:hypothetical protein
MINNMSDRTISVVVSMGIIIALVYLHTQTSKLKREVGSIERYMIEKHHNERKHDMQNNKKEYSYTDEYGDTGTDMEIQGNPHMAPPRVILPDDNNNGVNNRSMADGKTPLRVADSPDDEDDDDDYLDGPVLGPK